MNNLFGRPIPQLVRDPTDSLDRRSPAFPLSCFLGLALVV